MLVRPARLLRADNVERRVATRILASLALLTAACAWGWCVVVPTADASHQGHERHVGQDLHEPGGAGRQIPGVPFRLYIATGSADGRADAVAPADMEAAAQTVMEALIYMAEHRHEFPRFDESLQKAALQAVMLEPTVLNQDGRAFPFLVVRTPKPGKVNLLISASMLKENGHLGQPDRLVPLLAREFQWVVSKAETTPKSKTLSANRDLAHTVVYRNDEIFAMSGDQRAEALQQLFETYLKTVDDQLSLEGQPYYEVGSGIVVPPTQSDSTMKLYDMRVREALLMIVRETYFQEHMPRAVTSLLNGTIWNVAFVKIDQRDWATRTRVLPEEKAVVIGKAGYRIQPAAILLNTYRSAAPDDPFYRDTKELPMGALPPGQLARVIALEIQHNVVEKSQAGHVAQDKQTAPE